MPSQSSDNQNKPRRNLKTIAAEQNGYTLNEEDLSTLQRWKDTLAYKTGYEYTPFVLGVCEHYVLPIHELTPDLWLDYINKVIPDRVVTNKMSLLTSKLCSRALYSFLDFYSKEHVEFKRIKRPKRRKSDDINADQKKYVLSEEDKSSLANWNATLSPRTGQEYTSYILKVCEHYALPIHKITPTLWLNYMDNVVPDLVATCEVSESTSKGYYYAIYNFLEFYSMDHPEFKSIKRPKRRKLQDIPAKQKNYTLSKADLSILQRWRMLFNTSKTRQVYISCILTVCDYYSNPIHEITPDLWINYVNNVLSMQLVNRKVSVSTARIYYYAIAGFLDFYSSEAPEFTGIKKLLMNPANAPTPKVSQYPTASQMATILQTVQKTDRQVYLAMLLAYECALTSGEIIDLKASDFIRDDKGNCMLNVSGSSKRLLVIRPDLMEQVEDFFLHGGYYGDDWMFHNQYGSHIGATTMQRYCQKAQQPLIDTGILLESYPLRSIRSAALQRMMATDGASVSTTAQYAGLGESYVYTLQATIISSAVQLPGTKHGYSIADLLDSRNSVASSAPNNYQKENRGE